MRLPQCGVPEPDRQNRNLGRTPNPHPLEYPECSHIWKLSQGSPVHGQELEWEARFCRREDGIESGGGNPLRQVMGEVSDHCCGEYGDACRVETGLLMKGEPSDEQRSGSGHCTRIMRSLRIPPQAFWEEKGTSREQHGDRGRPELMGITEA